MMLLWIAVLLPFLTLATDINWQYQIYVSSSDGTNSSSCWNGSVLCNTLKLALQGVQHNSTVIYLYPGIYTLDDEVQVRNISRVAIIGLGDNVTISCQLVPLTSQWLDNINFQCVAFNNNCPTTISMPCPYNKCLPYTLDIQLYSTSEAANCWSCNNSNRVCTEKNIKFNAFLYDSCNNKNYLESKLTVCIISGPESVKLCSNDKNNSCINISIDDSLSFCYVGEEIIMIDGSTIDIDVIFQASNVSTNRKLTITPTCSVYMDDYCLYAYSSTINSIMQLNTTTGECAIWQLSSTPQCYFEQTSLAAANTCATNRKGSLCGFCKDGYSVPINLPTKCVQCDPLIGWVLFVTVQLLPVTVMVLLIIVLNIQLTSGFINALVIYSQILTTVYPGFNSMFGPLCYYSNNLYFNVCYPALLLIPLNIFNLDFTVFLNGYPLCISSATTPLGAISFWYVIGLYPLVLLLLLYVWITLYDKGYKVIVLITRPIHHLLARFWHMTNIEPSLPHSIASIYLLCFMQLAATSFKLLHFSIHDDKVAFFYDGTLNYFGWPHSFAGIFAILVLILLVLIPMLYIQLYPFKPFHKLLECLHLNNWQILMSLGDVFTGPYKNGTTNTLDYRYFAGFYLLLRIIILFLYFVPVYVISSFYVIPIVYIIQTCVFGLFSGALMIFRPYQKSLNNFIEFLIFLFLTVLSLLPFEIYDYTKFLILIAFFIDCLVFGLIMSVYFIYWTVKKIRSCYGYCRSHRLLSANGIANDTVLK